MSKSAAHPARGQVLLALAIIALAFTMRGPITAIGVLTSQIQQNFALSSTAAGLLTSIPLFSFAALSIFVPAAASKMGNDRCILLGMLLLIFGILMRSLLGVAGLFCGMLLIGMGICVLNVLAPSIIKASFPLQMGLMTGLYNVAMSLSSALASGISVPVSQHLGWQASLGLWAILSALALLLWLIQGRLRARSGLETPVITQPTAAPQGRPLYRSALAWQVSFCMGLQAFIWYSLSAWLPTIWQGKGISAETAGYLGTLLQLFCLPSSIIAPVLATRLRRQRGLSAICYGFYGLGVLCIWLSSAGPSAYVAAAVMGIGCGTGVPMAITFIALRTSSVQQAAQLSGLSQTLGYSLAAIGPTIMGALHDAAGSWVPCMIMLLAAAAAMLLCGQLAGRNKKIPL